MHEDHMLEFVKALGHADRLRIVGMLTQAPASAVQVSQTLGMPFRDAMNHLAYLAHMGIVRSQPAALRQDDLYELIADSMEKAMLRAETPREVYVPDPNLDEKSRKVLAAHLNADGSIRQIPAQPAKLQVILNYLLQAFTPGVIYTEKEVNMIIRRFHIDTAGLRRDMIDRGMMQRKSDGSQYWRPV